VLREEPMKLKYCRSLLVIFGLAVSCLMPAATNQAPRLQTDITFVVAGKTGNFRQSAAGMVSALNYHFFAEIFIQNNRRIKQAALLTPDNLYVVKPFWTNHLLV
jgi:hypothetical protein